MHILFFLLFPGNLLLFCLSWFNFFDIVKQVELDVEVRAFLYNTSGAYYKCSLSHGECNLELSFSKGNIGLLTSPSPAPVSLVIV